MYRYLSYEEDICLETNEYSVNADAVENNTISTLKFLHKKHKSYKHIPHKEKPPQIVARRNARERNRVRSVNEAFMKLRNVVPIENTRGKRLSKLKTLLYAIEYIAALNNILKDTSSNVLNLNELMRYEYAIEKFTDDTWNDGRDLSRFIY